ncbi:MAG: hypothetical protein H6738_16700 [Alphaproteobacteria bacterium]|nr:hypothetical protein [Alphaproteobacteria bacterium]MCB9698422.1 hypothetical protein [Alphaproteobacteria bacterium]
MRWLDVGDDAHGIIAVGRVATGVIAVGQTAWGAIAVGQFAFGLLAVGQVAVGGAALGTVVVALWEGWGLAGFAARGRGLVVSLLPSLGPPLEHVAEVPFEQAAGDGSWTRIQLQAAQGGFAVFADGVHVPARLDGRLARSASTRGPSFALARLRTSPHGLVVDALRDVPTSRAADPRWWATWGVQLSGLLIVGALVWWSVVRPLAAGWFGVQGVFFD